MPHRTWWKKINLISTALCYFSLKLFLKMSMKWISQTDNFITFIKYWKCFNLFLCCALVDNLHFCTDAKSAVQPDQLWQYSMQSSLSFEESHFAFSMDFLLLRRDTKTGHHERDKLLLCFVRAKNRRLVVASCVQDDVTFLFSAKHSPSISSTLFSVLLLHWSVGGSSQENKCF